MRIDIPQDLPHRRERERETLGGAATEREFASHSRSKRDPREPVDARCTRRDRIPSQTIGMQLRPEGAERLGQSMIAKGEIYEEQ